MNNNIFTYHGNGITFQNHDGSVMVNATEMAKSFKKLTADWLRQKRTEEYINALSSVKGIPITKLSLVIQGGKNQGTWFHEDIALEFSRWLSPEFAIWTNDRLKELLKSGFTHIKKPTLKQLAQWVVEAEEVKELQAQQLKLQAPKVKYHDVVLQSHGVYVTNQIAKELGMSAIALNKLLHNHKIQYKTRDTWVLYQHYQNKDYTKTNTYTYTGGDGETRTTMQTVWTEKGRKFIHNIVTSQLKSTTI